MALLCNVHALEPPDGDPMTSTAGDLVFVRLDARRPAPNRPAVPTIADQKRALGKDGLPSKRAERPAPTFTADLRDPRQLLQYLDQGGWRELPREEVLLRLFQARKAVRAHRGAGVTQEEAGSSAALEGRLVEYLRLVNVRDQEKEVFRRAQEAIDLANRGKIDSALVLLRPYFNLPTGDLLASPACVVAGWLHLRRAQYKRADELLSRCKPTETALHLLTRAQMGARRTDNARVTLARMKELYPRSWLTAEMSMALGEMKKPPFAERLKP